MFYVTLLLDFESAVFPDISFYGNCHGKLLIATFDYNYNYYHCCYLCYRNCYYHGWPHCYYYDECHSYV